MNFSVQTDDTVTTVSRTNISSVPILFYSSRIISSAVVSPRKDTHIVPSFQPASHAVGKQWLCINDVVGSFTTWSRTGDSMLIKWEVKNIFVADVASSLFQLIYPSIKYTTTSALVPTCTSLMSTEFHPFGMDSMFILFVHGSFVSWLLDMLKCISIISLACPNIGLANLWVPCHYFNDDIDILPTHIVPSWSYCIESFNSASIGNKVCALCTCITLLCNNTPDDSSSSVKIIIHSYLLQKCLGILWYVNYSKIYKIIHPAVGDRN